MTIFDYDVIGYIWLMAALFLLTFLWVGAQPVHRNIDTHQSK